MTKKRWRPDSPRRSVPTGRGPSPNGTRAHHDAERAERDALRQMFDVSEAAERLDNAPATRPRASASPRARTLTLKRRHDGLTAAEAEARLRVRGLIHNAGLIEDFSGPLVGGAVEDLTATVEALDETVAAVQRGELGDAEALLVAQASTLNAIFARCATAASRNLEERYLDSTERYLRMALKAQSQCRATIETLAVLKNPTTVFARQANIAHGPQQVNNTQMNTAVAVVSEEPPIPGPGPDAPDASRARGKSGQNELLT